MTSSFIVDFLNLEKRNYKLLFAKLINCTDKTTVAFFYEIVFVFVNVTTLLQLSIEELNYGTYRNLGCPSLTQDKYLN